MPGKVVQVDGVGNIEFPDDMTDDQIAQAIQQTHFNSPPQFSANPQKPNDIDTFNTFLHTVQEDPNQPSAPGGGAPQQPGAIRNFANNFADSTIGTHSMEGVKRGFTQGFPYMAQHPVDSAGMLYNSANESQQQLIDEAYQEQQTPGFMHKLRGLALGMYSALPVIGPALAHAGKQLESGDFSGGAGSTAGILTMLKGPKATGEGVVDTAANLRGKISSGVQNVKTRIDSPLGDTMNTPRGTTPAESSTPAQLLQYANENNIPVNAAQVTEHNLPRNLQSAGERASVGGTAVKQQTQASRAAIADHVNSLAEEMSPSSETPNTAASGQVLKQGIADALDREQQKATQNFQEVAQKAKGVTVDFRPMKQLADSMMQDSNFIRQNAKALDPKRGTAVLQVIQNLPDRGTFADAQALRSKLFDEAQHPDNVISQEAQGWIKRMTAATDDQMMTAAEGQPGLEDAFRKANQHWRGLEDDFNSPRSPLYQALKEPMPEKIPQKFLQKGSTGGSPSTIQLLNKYEIDPGPLKRELLMDLADQQFKMKGSSLGGYDDNFLRALYTPEELDHVYKTGALTRSANLNTNPSGTSGVMGAMEDVKSPKNVLMPKFAAAKLTMSPRFNRWLTNQSEPANVRFPNLR